MEQEQIERWSLLTPKEQVYILSESLNGLDPPGRLDMAKDIAAIVHGCIFDLGYRLRLTGLFVPDEQLMTTNSDAFGVSGSP